MPSTLHAEEPPKPPKIEARLEGGWRIEAEVHLNRNAIKGNLHLGDDVLAVTDTGALLRFSYPGLELVRERIGPEVVNCLGRGESGMPLAGLTDGRICRIDPKTLELIELAKFLAAVVWLGWCEAIGNRPAGLVGVERRRTIVQVENRPQSRIDTVVHDLAVGRTLEVEGSASPFLLDRVGRLWIGTYVGGRGEEVACVDLIQGTTRQLKPPPSPKPNPDDDDEDEEPKWRGLRGFIELRNGQVWAYGGATQFTSHEAFITRVDGDAPRVLFWNEQEDFGEQKPETDKAWCPILTVIEEENSLLVVDHRDVFRVDLDLKAWNKIAKFDAFYREGRSSDLFFNRTLSALDPRGRRASASEGHAGDDNDESGSVRRTEAGPSRVPPGPGGDRPPRLNRVIAGEVAH